MTQPFRRRPLLLFLILVACAAIATGAFLATRGSAQQPDAPAAAPRSAAAPVIVAPAVTARDDVSLDVVGSGLASNAITVYPAASGEVERVAFSAGDRVKEGQLLIQLADRSERIAVDQAQARVDAAARLLRRYEKTRDSGAVSASVLDEARLALRNAELELARSREALRERTVLAPFAGVTGIAQVDPGERVTPTTALTTLDRRDPLSVEFQVPEPYLGRLERGQKVTLNTIAYPGRDFAGSVSHIGARIDPVTRSVTARATVPNAEDLLRPGMSFSVGLALPGRTVLQVPELAVQWGREGSHVWIVRDGNAHKVLVRVLRRLDAAVLVEGELKAGEPLVVEGIHRLRPQRPVRVVEDRSERAQPANGEARQ